MARIAIYACVVGWAGAVAGGAEKPWPADVAGFVPPRADEHPRLFFRKADLPALKQRAETPEGRAIVTRLRFLLNGSDGRTMPHLYNDTKGDTDRTRTDLKVPAGRAYTLWHAAGYGMLHQLTGERLYADLGRQCVEKALAGTRDVDGRCAFVRPAGALRAGPSLSAIAMGYDLCHDGWDEAFRRKVAAAIQNYDYDGRPAPGSSLAAMCRNPRLGTGSNHGGPQIGGASIALLAIRGDAGTDDKLVEGLLAENARWVKAQLTGGWGPSGWYAQGDGAGCISSDNAFLPALKAWRVAAGKDYVTGRPTPQWMTLKWVMGTVLMPDGRVAFPSRAMYPHNVWARKYLSGAGQFAQGFGALEDKYKPALLYLYNRCFRAADEKLGAPFDTICVYPHRTIQSLVNWPLGMAERDPAEVLGHVQGVRHGYGFCRTRWKDANDLMVSLKAGVSDQIIVIGRGMRLELAGLPGATFTYYRQARDGSVIVSNPKGRTYLAVDLSGAGGAELLLAVVGRGARGGKDFGPGKDAAGVGGATARCRLVEAGGYRMLLMTVQTGPPPEAKVQGDAVVVGGQTIRFDGKRIHLAKMGDGPPEEVNDDGFVYTPAEDAKVRGEPAAAARQKAEAEQKRLNDALAKVRSLMQAGKLPDAQLAAQELVTGAPESPQADQARALLKEIQRKLLSPAAPGAPPEL